MSFGGTCGSMVSGIRLGMRSRKFARLGGSGSSVGAGELVGHVGSEARAEPGETEGAEGTRIAWTLGL